MKFRQIIQKYGHLRYRELPDHIRHLVDKDTTCRDWFTRSDAQRDLLSLKKYEKPAPTLHDRVSYNVLTRIKAGEQLPTPELANPRGPVGWIPTVAATALAILGASYYLLPNTSDPHETINTNHTVTRENNLAEQPRIEDLFQPIPTETNAARFIAGNTNQFPHLLPSKPGGTDIKRVIGPPSDQ